MILYLGNMLSKWGRSLTVIETLTPLLARTFVIKAYSHRRYQVLRLLDMVFNLVKYRELASVVLIDSYSTLAFWYTIVLSYLCRLLGIPYITILHGGNFPTRLERSPILTRVVFRNASAIVSPSFYLKDAFERHGYEVSCIPNSLKLEDFPFKPRDEIKVNILWVRSFHEIYNPSMAIDVLAELKRKYPGATLCMVGAKKDSTFDKVLEKIEKLNLADSIKLTGSLSRVAWVELSAGFDLFINTSNVDNTPNSVLEAMSLGIPVVSTRVGGVPYLISENVNGLLVDSNDSRMMAEKISFLVENPERALALAKNARSFVESFDWRRIQHQWTKLLTRFVRLK